MNDELIIPDSRKKVLWLRGRHAELARGARPFGVVEHVVTLTQFRRQGFARMLLRYALELACSKDCCKVILLSGADRTDAHRLYESVGFRGDIERGFVAKP